jgi:hypothetical protein
MIYSETVNERLLKRKLGMYMSVKFLKHTNFHFFFPRSAFDEYAGNLVSADSYMNFQLDHAEEYVNGRLEGELL